MSKKKSKKFSLLAVIFLLVGVIAAIVCLAAPAADTLMFDFKLLNPLNGEVVSEEITALMTGFGLAFGTSIENEHISMTTSDPNTAVLVFYILFAIGALLVILALLTRLLKKAGISRVFALVSGIALLVGGIGFFCIPSLVSQDLLDLVNALNINNISAASLTLGVGGYLPAICGLTGALTSFGAAIIKK